MINAKKINSLILFIRKYFLLKSNHEFAPPVAIAKLSKDAEIKIWDAIESDIRTLERQGQIFLSETSKVISLENLFSLEIDINYSEFKINHLANLKQSVSILSGELLIVRNFNNQGKFITSKLIMNFPC